MRRVNAMLLVGLLALAGFALPVQAGDIFDGRGTLVEHEMPGARTWYVRIDTGFSSQNVSGLTEGGLGGLSDRDVGRAWSLGGGIGRSFGNNFRADLTLDHRFGSDVEGTAGGGFPGVRGFSLDSTVILANLYYDFDTGGILTPYVGFGLGAAYNRTSSGSFPGGGTIDGDGAWSFAAAAMAGASIRLLHEPGAVHGSVKDGSAWREAGRNLYLDLGYRYLYLGDAQTGRLDSGVTPVSSGINLDDLSAHEFRIGLRTELR